MLSDFEHQAGKAARDKLYEALDRANQRNRPWTDEQVASFMASAARQTVHNCIFIAAGCLSIEEAIGKLQSLITTKSAVGGE